MKAAHNCNQMYTKLKHKDLLGFWTTERRTQQHKS